ncbi:MAG: prepilin-type N-terminal cleavage/methylation domain-containing protein [Candidatus Paceibacterota bacterium]|jgi:hypothetical protein
MNSKNKINGFTLVEALVAISILMVAVTSPMAIAQRGLASAVYSKDQMTATFLAQDALEYIKNVRDYVGLNKNSADDPGGLIQTDWLGVLSQCYKEDGGCKIDTIKPVPIGVTKENPTGLLKINRDSNGNLLYYDYTSNIVSKFSRIVEITLSPDNNEALVAVTVRWPSTNGVEYNSVVLQNYIYDYWENL